MRIGSPFYTNSGMLKGGKTPRGEHQNSAVAFLFFYFYFFLKKGRGKNTGVSLTAFTFITKIYKLIKYF